MPSGRARLPGRIGPGTAVGVAWLASVGFDLFLHAGVLAALYARPSSFLLSADAAFRRIPLGYASFLVLTSALYWLVRQMDIEDWFAGLRLGLFAGLTIWGAWTLGLYSISVAEGDLLVGWWLGQSVELGLAGAFLGAAASGMERRRYLIKGAWVVGTLVVLWVILQVSGLTPAMKTVGGGA